ncbi:hypothetical protein VMCG_03845 [Cytospora schulzeri]|uniref:1-alkyl-2-acetylglycerophosphocholine esterase n=1 Tax=Cytospora schulzeri TaxID=448051 RepID=A0A423WV52_9PEZI|nr:hypothetical protein VMCG_03845 [Valsa malicola]
MSSSIMVPPPVLPGANVVMSALMELSGSLDGPAVVNFTDSNVNMLPPLPGPIEVGVHTFSVFDELRDSSTFCAAGDRSNPHALCKQPREIRVSMFYPACPPEADEHSPPEPVNKRHFAPVFEPELVSKVSQLTLGNSTAMHNLMSQALEDAPVCKGEYTMVMFTPAVGGQRQAYTQAASELAFLGYIAITVDHLYISGFVELSDGTIQDVSHGDRTLVEQAGFEQLEDIKHLGNSLTLGAVANRLPIWENQAFITSYFCVFGHGLGGEIADVLAWENLTCGGHLEGLLTLPFPLDRGDLDTVVANSVQKRSVGSIIMTTIGLATMVIVVTRATTMAMTTTMATTTTILAMAIKALPIKALPIRVLPTRVLPRLIDPTGAIVAASLRAPILALLVGTTGVPSVLTQVLPTSIAPGSAAPGHHATMSVDGLEAAPMTTSITFPTSRATTIVDLLAAGPTTISITTPTTHILATTTATTATHILAGPMVTTVLMSAATVTADMVVLMSAATVTADMVVMTRTEQHLSTDTAKNLRLSRKSTLIE